MKPIIVKLRDLGSDSEDYSTLWMCNGDLETIQRMLDTTQYICNICKIIHENAYYEEDEDQYVKQECRNQYVKLKDYILYENICEGNNLDIPKFMLAKYKVNMVEITKPDITIDM